MINMKYAELKYNDIVDCPSGICVSYWCQGCPIHCKGCHNPQTWDFNGGIEIDRDVLIKEIIEAISKNGIQRNFSVLGGEPLAPFNIADTFEIIKAVKEAYPCIEVYLWTGYYLKDLSEEVRNAIYEYVNVLIEGSYDESKRDITLPMRGSSNQRIIYIKEMVNACIRKNQTNT